uniref:Uncharacterized protein n=1 Tax=Fagus sylvatica TaxID=28930 RepID=A0A2N9I2C7_FAGSY
MYTGSIHRKQPRDQLQKEQVSIISVKELEVWVSFSFYVAGVYFAENLNRFLGENWKSFAGQNYFDQNGVFLSAVWSGPLLVIAIIILVNTLFSLCNLIVRWKKAELRHRARLARNKQE